MIVNWHCRGCNAHGQQTFGILEINSKSLIDGIIRSIKHDCPDRDIGISARDIEDKG